MSTKLKVCVINPNYYRSSGVTIAIQRIYEGSFDLPISWLFIDCKYGLDSEYEKINWIPNDSLTEFSLMSKSSRVLLKSLWRLRKFLVKHKVDVIHVHHRRLALLVGWIAKSLNIPIVYTGQLTYSKNFLFYLIPKLTIVAITESVSDNIKRTTWIRNVNLISNPAPFTEMCPVVSQKYSVVGCIARLDPVKNHENLLKAWSLVNPKSKNLKLLLVGEGKLKRHLIDLSISLNIYETIIFSGYVSNVKEIIEQCDFLILPSWVEGQGIVIIEAAGLGRPTLVSNVDGAKDCVPDNVSLTNRVDPRSPALIAKALNEWIDNKDLVVEDGKKFYSYLKEKSSISNVSQKYYRLYKSLV